MSKEYSDKYFTEFYEFEYEHIDSMNCLYDELYGIIKNKYLKDIQGIAYLFNY